MKIKCVINNFIILTFNPLLDQGIKEVSFIFKIIKETWFKKIIETYR